jgi:hypothetical protein
MVRCLCAFCHLVCSANIGYTESWVGGEVNLYYI